MPSPIKVWHHNIPFEPHRYHDRDNKPSCIVGRYHGQNEYAWYTISILRNFDVTFTVHLRFANLRDEKDVRTTEDVIFLSDLKAYIEQAAKTVNAWTRELKENDSKNDSD